MSMFALDCRLLFQKVRLYPRREEKGEQEKKQKEWNVKCAIKITSILP